MLYDNVLSCCQAITKYVTSRGFALDSHEIVTNFPRRILTDMDETKTLKDLGLFPQETVFVQKRWTTLSTRKIFFWTKWLPLHYDTIFTEIIHLNIRTSEKSDKKLVSIFLRIMMITTAFFFNGFGADLSSRRLHPCWVLRENLSFFGPFFEFFHRFLSNKSCPYLEFLDKYGFEFLRGGQKLSFFSQLSFRKNVEKISLDYYRTPPSWLLKFLEPSFAPFYCAPAQLTTDRSSLCLVACLLLHERKARNAS